MNKTGEPTKGDVRAQIKQVRQGWHWQVDIYKRMPLCLRPKEKPFLHWSREAYGITWLRSSAIRQARREMRAAHSQAAARWEQVGHITNEEAL